MYLLLNLVLCDVSTLTLLVKSLFALPAIGESQLRTDAGWGCTLRSGQMAIGEALKRCMLGADWRWPEDNGQQQCVEEQLEHVVSYFHDTEEAAFSIHTLCRVGRRYG